MEYLDYEKLKALWENEPDTLGKYFPTFFLGCILLLMGVLLYELWKQLRASIGWKRWWGQRSNSGRARTMRNLVKARMRVLKEQRQKTDTIVADKIEDCLFELMDKEHISAMDYRYYLNRIGRGCNFKDLIPQKLNKIPDPVLLKAAIKQKLADGLHRPVKLPDTKMVSTPLNKLEASLKSA